VFVEGGKGENPEKKPESKTRTKYDQQKVQDSKLGHTGDRERN